MSESKMVTEREAVLRERDAFVKGSQFEDDAWREMLRVNHSSGADCIDASRKRYPLPKVERPRVVTEKHPSLDQDARRWRVVGGRFETSFVGCEWVDGAMVRSVPICPERVKLWADLLANPTELVEDAP